MEMNAFKQFSKDESAKYVWANGTQMGFVDQGNCKIILYTVHRFYVGIFYSMLTNSIEKVQTFTALIMITEGQQKSYKDFIHDSLDQTYIQN